MLRALGHEQIELSSYGRVPRPLAHRPGCVLLGVDPIDPEPLALLSSLCRGDHALPFILLFTATPPALIRKDLRSHAAAVLRFPLPASQLEAAVAQALDVAVAHSLASQPGQPNKAENLLTRPIPIPTDCLAAHQRTTSASSAPAHESRFAALAPAYADRPRHLIGPLKTALEGPERALILEALRAFEWNRNDTAQALDICRSALYRKMVKYGLLDFRE
jgi:DNA-binding NtrC family response regulator